MAPEVMMRMPHNQSVDFWAVGVILYEIMNFKRPYNGRSKQEIKEQMLAKSVQMKHHDIPEEWSIEAADLCNRLIRRKAAERMSSAEQIKKHPWLRGFNWENLFAGQIIAPWVPP